MRNLTLLHSLNPLSFHKEAAKLRRSRRIGITPPRGHIIRLPSQ
jgi:hypothetical protein